MATPVFPIADFQTLLAFLEGKGGTWQDAATAALHIIEFGISFLGAPVPKQSRRSRPTLKGVRTSLVAACQDAVKTPDPAALPWPTILQLLLQLLQSLITTGG
jgi:hypothetical protein